MTWLVTGGSGFLGAHLLRRLRGEGLAARSLDLVPPQTPVEGVQTVLGDVRDPDAVRRAVAGVEVVVHAAAALPSRARQLGSVNVDGTDCVARSAREAGVRRSLLVSSAVVYGLLPPPVRETDAPRPIERYGRTKLQAEELWLATSPEPVVLRPSAVVGPGRLGVFGILFRWIHEGRRVYVLGDGANRYQLLDVADLVQAVLLAGERPQTPEVLNLGGRISGTVRADLESLIAHTGSDSIVKGVPALPARAALAGLAALRLSPLGAWHRRSAAHDVVLDCARARSELEWEPALTGAEALARAYDWFLTDGQRRTTGATHTVRWREGALALLRRFS
jgi:nucleoside-diphosphate-sugar epimerase